MDWNAIILAICGVAGLYIQYRMNLQAKADRKANTETTSGKLETIRLDVNSKMQEAIKKMEELAFLKGKQSAVDDAAALNITEKDAATMEIGRAVQAKDAEIPK